MLVVNICRINFSKYLKHTRIMRYITSSYTLEINAVVEQKIQHILEYVRAMMFEMNVKKMCLANVCHYVVKLINRMPTTIIKNHVPYYAFFWAKAYI